MKIAFAIGNGFSRSVFDLELLKGKGVTYGCNVLIEDFQLDNTVACDRSALVYLIASGFDSMTNLWTRARWRNTIGSGSFNDLPTPIENPVERWDKEIHWGSGTHALNLAAEQGADEVAMIGFDLWIRSDGQNNIYQDRYPLYENKGVGPECWIYQIKRLFEKFPDTSFVQIQPTGWKDPDEWSGYDNYSRDTFAGLKTLLQDIDADQ